MGRNELFETVETMPVLPPIMHPLARDLAERHRRLIADLVHGLGPALHVVLPQVFSDNVRQFRQALALAGVNGFVLFAKKANKARCFVERCADLGIGVDAASLQEAAQALECGVPGMHIGISGPAKSPDLLTLALRQNCLVAIDGLEELHCFAALAERSGRQGRLLLRRRPDTQPGSRFGMTGDECGQAIRACVARRDHVVLEGFAFHLSGYSPQARAHQADRMIDCCVDAQRQGLPRCRTVNIGGGFAVRYVEAQDWHAFSERQRPTHYHADKSFPDFYPYYSASHGAGMLADVLACTLEDGSATLAQRLKQHDIRLLLEPGRALLDQAGFSAFTVQGVKDRGASEGYGIVTAGATSFSVSEQWFNSEYLPDPMLLDDSTDGAPYAACIGGASCLDSDMLTWRKIRFPRRPRAGDVLLYANTAGYQMDSNESPFHGLPLPPKVAVTIDDGIARWRLDRRDS